MTEPVSSTMASAGWSEVRFQTLLEQIPAAAYTCDPTGLITFYNQPARHLWGRTPRLNDPVDRFCGSFRLYYPDGSAVDHSCCWMALALQHQRPYNGREIVIERPDGTRVTGLAHANPYHDDRGRLAGAVNVLVDITRQKQVEQELREAHRAKDEFLATLSHELRNPLAAIRNAGHILSLRQQAEPDVKWAAEVINRQTRQMTRLMDDLLDLGRIISGKLVLQRELVELEEVMRLALEASRPLIEARGQHLSVPPFTQTAVIEGDPARLAQALANLLCNAARYTPRDGHITLLAREQEGTASLTVRDTGIGIDPSVLPRIFDMFAQGHPRAAESSEGLGIGLTLARRLVELHGGTLVASSDGVGRGSEFTMTLTALSAAHRVAGADRTDPPRLALRILVVDDNADSADSLALMLQLLGNETRTAHDGYQALQAVSEHHPDVVLLDLGLPGMNGLDVARQIRGLANGATGIVLIAVTGLGQEADTRRTRDAGFDHHLVKPVDLPALLTILTRVSRGQTELVKG